MRRESVERSPVKSFSMHRLFPWWNNRWTRETFGTIISQWKCRRWISYFKCYSMEYSLIEKNWFVNERIFWWVRSWHPLTELSIGLDPNESIGAASLSIGQTSFQNESSERSDQSAFVDSEKVWFIILLLFRYSTVNYVYPFRGHRRVVSVWKNLIWAFWLYNILCLNWSPSIGKFKVLSIGVLIRSSRSVSG